MLMAEDREKFSRGGGILINGRFVSVGVYKEANKHPTGRHRGEDSVEI